MFGHFRIPMVKTRGRVTLQQGEIKIKEKNTDEREETSNKRKRKEYKSIDKRYTPQNESLAPLRFFLSLLWSQENQVLNSNDRS